MPDWCEQAPGVYTRRYEELDLTVGLVVGGERCLVVDTRGSRVQGRELAGAVREVTPLPVTIALTHAHFDHAFGVSAFPHAPVWAHTRCRTALAARGDRDRREWTERYRRDGRSDLADELAATPVVLPTRTFDDVARLDLGGRGVELVHPGRGHTDHDVLVVAGDVVFAGDLVEHDAGGSFTAESLGPDPDLDACPAALDVVAGHRPRVVVAGHGEPVDSAFLTRAGAQLRTLARLRSDVRAGALGLDDALAASPLRAEVTRAALA
ncbi:hypothetical protein ACZ91_09890 [Streptomyces regensis]|nr:hypothetical protein ACZ91_09890 [Streptomyces regensis]